MILATHPFARRSLNPLDENGNIGCAVCGRPPSAHREPQPPLDPAGPRDVSRHVGQRQSSRSVGGQDDSSGCCHPVGAIHSNCFNGVVQCHCCGEVFEVLPEGWESWMDDAMRVSP
jgi:hypothetical protein